MDKLITSRQYTAWQLIKLYWQSEQRLFAYIFISIVIMMTIILVGFDVAFSYWFNFFYNALQTYDSPTTIYLLGVFIVLAACNIIISVYRYYLSQLFGLRWRRWLTHQFIGRWLSFRDYYYLEHFDEHTDNPDQRIQEDVGALVISSLTLLMGIISAITTIVGFVYVLWQLSGVFELSLGSLGKIQVPGYLVWIAILYSGIGTYLIFKIGRPLISLNFEQQRREATFRFAAIDLRSHSEHIALYRGEEQQKNVLYRVFGRVLENWYFIVLRQKIILWFTAGFNQAAVLLPLLVALPNYFGKVFLLGGLMQSLRAFGSLQDALAFLVNAYPQIAEWRAVTQRLTTFVNHMQTIDEKVKTYKELHIIKKDQKNIAIERLSIYTPEDEELLKEISLELLHGHHYLIKGPSGIGKSTFVRTIAGIWPFAKGKIILPQKQSMMYLPQKSYMPIGTLAEAILFPQYLDQHTEDEDRVMPIKKSKLLEFLKEADKKEIDVSLKKQLEEVLRLCHLEDLIPRLFEIATWSQQLSPGEQQRIAFARVLLQKPDWVFLDESTSMLDLGNEKYLYELLRSHLPHTSLVSVGHRQTIEIFHDEIIDLSSYMA